MQDGRDQPLGLAGHTFDEALRTLVSELDDGTVGVPTGADSAGGYEWAAADPLADLPSYLNDRGLLLRGGMGEIRLVQDTRLRRTLALKVASVCARPGQDAAEVALAEARTTAQLEHPSIVPVHDAGVFPDGRVWFTMRLVAGGTLLTYIAAVHQVSTNGTWGTTADGWNLRRLVTVFEQVCQAVAYAHRRNVTHRDLKPTNILVGSFGEVQVIDWGLATAGEAPEGGLRVLGTPGYMSPEQARGNEQEHTTASDVFSLGATLYVLLTSRVPFPGDYRRVLLGPPDAIAGPLEVPTELAQAVTLALHADPAERPSAVELVRRVRAWLDGTRLGEEARAMVEAVRPNLDLARAHQLEARLLRDHARALLDPLPPWAPEETKHPGWALQDAAAGLDRDTAMLRVRYLEGLHAALNLDPGCTEAEDQLAAWYRDELTAAQEARDETREAQSRFLLERYDRRGAHRALLNPTGRLTLLTDPPGATVRAERYVKQRRRLVLEPAGALGTAPLVAVPLAAGSYRLRLEAPGRETVYYPVHLGQGSDWDGVPPDQAVPTPIPLPVAGSLGPDDCYVPAGWFTAYGDPDAADPLEARRIWVDGFVIRRFPVTVGAYFTFVNALVDAGADADVERLLPPAGAQLGNVTPWARGPDGHYQPALGGDGAIWPADWPMTMIPLHAMEAYAAWESARTGRPWRLPHDIEREKAARGVDGRWFPWGDVGDSSWSCIQSSHEGAPQRVSVYRFPVDESPYGVRGAAGNVSDRCRNAYSRGGTPAGRLDVGPVDRDSTFLVSRGPGYPHPAEWARVAGRFAARPTDTLVVLGFRLAYSTGAATER